MIDSHVHLDVPQFNKDREKVIESARKAGVKGLINVSLNLQSCLSSIKLAENNPDIWAAVGIHPHEASSMKAGDEGLLKKFAENPRVVAIGETGLDYFRNLSSKEAQIASFKSHLNIAESTGLPIIIHVRQSHEEVLSLLKGSGFPAGKKGWGVIHCYSGNWEQAQEYLKLGFLLSFSGSITYSQSKEIGRIISQVPLDGFLVETDCPYLTPLPYKNKRNEPAYLGLIIKNIAERRGISEDVIMEATMRNSKELFRI